MATSGQIRVDVERLRKPWRPRPAAFQIKNGGLDVLQLLSCAQICFVPFDDDDDDVTSVKKNLGNQR